MSKNIMEVKALNDEQMDAFKDLMVKMKRPEQNIIVLVVTDCDEDGVAQQMLSSCEPDEAYDLMLDYIENRVDIGPDDDEDEIPLPPAEEKRTLN